MDDRVKWFKAAASGDVDYISKHLEEFRGSKNDQQETAMMIAARAGHEAIVRILLNYEAIDTNSEGDTALVLAARQNDAAICKILATRERTILTSMGRDACAEAVMTGSYQAFEVLYEQTELVSDSTGMTILDYVSRMKDLRYLRALLSRNNLPTGYVSNTLALALNEGHTQAASLLEAYIANPRSSSPSRKLSAVAESVSPKLFAPEEGDPGSLSPHMHAMPMVYTTNQQIGVQIPVQIPASTNPLVFDPPSMLTAAVPEPLSTNASYIRFDIDPSARAGELRIELLDKLAAEGLIDVSSKLSGFLEELCDQAARAQLYRDQLEEQMHRFDEERIELLQQIDELQMVLSQYSTDDNARPAVGCSAAQVQFTDFAEVSTKITTAGSPGKLDSQVTMKQYREALRQSQRKLAISKAEAVTYKRMTEITMYNLSPLLDSYGFLSSVSLQPLTKNLQDLDKYVDTACKSDDKINNIIQSLIKKGTMCLESLDEIFVSILGSTLNSADFETLGPQKQKIFMSLDAELSAMPSPGSSLRRLLSPQTSSPPAHLQLSAYGGERGKQLANKVLVSKINLASAGLSVADLQNELDTSRGMKDSIIVETEAPEMRSVNMGTSNTMSGSRGSSSQREEAQCVECQSLRIQLAKVRNDHIMIQNEYMLLEAKFNDLKKTSTAEINDLVEKLSSSSEAIRKLNTEIVLLRSTTDEDQSTINDLKVQLVERQKELEDMRSSNDAYKDKIDSLTSRLTAVDTTFNTQPSFAGGNGSFNTRMSETMKHAGDVTKDDFFSLISMNVASRRESHGEEIHIPLAESVGPKYVDSATSPAATGVFSDNQDLNSTLQFAAGSSSMGTAPHMLKINTEVSESRKSSDTLKTLSSMESQDPVVLADVPIVLSPQQVLVTRSRSRVHEAAHRVPTAPPPPPQPLKQDKHEELEHEIERLSQKLNDASVAEREIKAKLEELREFSRRVTVQHGLASIDDPATEGTGISSVANAIIRNVAALEARLSQQSLYAQYAEELRTIYTELKVTDNITITKASGTVNDAVQSHALSEAVFKVIKRVKAMTSAMESKDSILAEISNNLHELDVLASSQQQTIDEQQTQLEAYKTRTSADEAAMKETAQQLEKFAALVLTMDATAPQALDVSDLVSDLPKNAATIFTTLSKAVETHLEADKALAETTRDEISQLRATTAEKAAEIERLTEDLAKKSDAVETTIKELDILREAEHEASRDRDRASESLRQAQAKITYLEKHASVAAAEPSVDRERIERELRQIIELPYKSLVQTITTSTAFTKATMPRSVQLYQEMSASNVDSPAKFFSGVFDELAAAALGSAKTIAYMRRELRDKTEDLEAVEEEVTHKNVRIHKLEEEIRQRTDYIKALEDEKTTSPPLDTDKYIEKEQYEELSSQVSDLTRELSAANQLVAQFKAQVASKEDLITNLQTRNSTLLSAKTDVETTVSEQRIQISNLELQLASVRHDASHLKTLLEDAKLDLENAKNDLELRKKELVSNKRNTEKILEETHENLSHAESRIMILTKELREVQAEVEDKEEEIASLHTKLREQKVTTARNSVEANTTATSADIAELTKAKKDLDTQLKVALKDLSEKTAECSRKTKVLEAAEASVEELNKRLMVLELEKNNNELRSNQKADALAKRVNDLVAECTALKAETASSNTTIYAKLETVTKKLLIFSIHVQQLISLHHRFIQEQMEHKTEIENLHKQEALLRNLRAQDSNSIAMLNTELEEAKRQYNAQLEHKAMELNNLREQMSCLSNDRNELALSFAALKESLNKESQHVQLPPLPVQEVQEAPATVHAEVGTTEHTEVTNIGVMMSPTKMTSMSVSVCNTEELDQLKINLHALTEKMKVVQAESEALAREKQDLLQQNILYKEELFASYTLISNRLESDSRPTSPGATISVLALVQQMIAKMNQLEDASHAKVNGSMTSSIDAPAVDVSIHDKTSMLRSSHGSSSSNMKVSVGNMEAIASTFAAKLIESIELSRIIESKNKQVDWIADEALRAHLTGTDLRDRAKVLSLARTKVSVVDMALHAGTVLATKDKLLKFFFSVFCDGSGDNKAFPAVFGRLVETLNSDLSRDLESHVRICQQTEEIGIGTTDDYDDSQPRPQVAKTTQTVIDQRDNMLLHEFTVLQSDFDTLKVSFSNTTVALNETMFKKQEIEREYAEIKGAFSGLQEENKKLLQEQEKLHKELSSIKANPKDASRTTSRSRALDIRDLIVSSSVYKPAPTIPTMAVGSPPSQMSASIVAITSSALDSSIIKPEQASFGLSPEHMVRATSYARSPKPREAGQRGHGSLSVSTHGKRGDVSPKPRSSAADNAQKSTR